MLQTRKAIVIDVTDKDNHISKLLVDIDGSIEKAINYTKICGEIDIGDIVVLNTGAVYLGLGTGGYNFVIHNYKNEVKDFSTDIGHIIKLRYTPFQVKCLAVEEPGSPYHSIIKENTEVDNLSVFIGQLHSMLAPLVFLLKYYNKDIKIGYIMTDSACLPIDYSDTVRYLKKGELLNDTITCGQAFGGDFETVNIYTALIAAKEELKADVILLTPGPGVVGTFTRYGHSGIEQGEHIDRVRKLQGLPIVIPRISFSDSRERHFGLSHHTLTALGEIASQSAYLPLPFFNRDKFLLIYRQLKMSGVLGKHKIFVINRPDKLGFIKKRGYNIQTMGRGLKQDPAFFLTVISAACFTARIKARR